MSKKRTTKKRQNRTSFRRNLFNVHFHRKRWNEHPNTGFVLIQMNNLCINGPLFYVGLKLNSFTQMKYFAVFFTRDSFILKLNNFSSLLREDCFFYGVEYKDSVLDNFCIFKYSRQIGDIFPMLCGLKC